MSANLRDSNFYASSPGLNKSKNNAQQLNTIDLVKKNYEPFNFENLNENENFRGEPYQDSYQGHQQMSMGQEQSIYPGQMQSIYAQQQPMIPGQSHGPVHMSMPGTLQQGNQPPILSNIDRAKLLEQDIAGIINIFKGFDIIEEKEKEGQVDPKEKENGVDASEVLAFLEFSKPQLDKEHQEILWDLLGSIKSSLRKRKKINEKDLLLVIDNVALRENEKSLNAKEMALFFSQIDKKERGAFGFDDLMDAYKENIIEKKGSMVEFRKLMAYISPNGVINLEEFYNILNNDKFMRYDF